MAKELNFHFSLVGLSNHPTFPGTTGSGNYVIICDVRPREQAEVLVTLGDLVGKKRGFGSPTRWHRS